VTMIKKYEEHFFRKQSQKSNYSIVFEVSLKT
jgi:hypothetical protein